MIPLFTSIPPRITRKSDDGAEIGTDYAIKCIESWRAAGFEPFTVNARCESLAKIVDLAHVEVITVERDASVQYGKPLVYLGDFVTASCSVSSGPVAIVNSDVLLDLSSDARKLVATLRPGQCVLSKRCDIEQMNFRQGVEFPHGYDFFAFHTQDLRRFSDRKFVIGLPWWDHYFPIQMYFRGVESLPVTKPFVFHLVHEERWELDRWIKLGNRFVAAIQQEIPTNFGHSRLAREFERLLKEAIAGNEGLDAERLRALQMKEDITVEERLNRWMLGRVATLNMRWLESLRLQQQ
jgi:hypothetical protein